MGWSGSQNQCFQTPNLLIPAIVENMREYEAAYEKKKDVGAYLFIFGETSQMDRSCHHVNYCPVVLHKSQVSSKGELAWRI